jgi:starvation-inducible DNA-binding protein
MTKKPNSSNSRKPSAQPRYHQTARELQAYGTVTSVMPLQLIEPVRLEMTEQLNQLLADTMTLRDLYKKSHWQVSGATFYQLHLLFDKHYEEQSEIVDAIAERIQLLGGISIAMAADVAELTRIPRPPKGREEVPVQLSRLLDAHEIIITHCRELAERATKLEDAGTNDLVVSDVLRPSELQSWFLSEHLVDAPLVEAEPLRESA